MGYLDHGVRLILLIARDAWQKMGCVCLQVRTEAELIRTLKKVQSEEHNHKYSLGPMYLGHITAHNMCYLTLQLFLVVSCLGLHRLHAAAVPTKDNHAIL